MKYTGQTHVNTGPDVTALSSCQFVCIVGPLDVVPPQLQTRTDGAVTANVYLIPPVSLFTEHTVDIVLTRATNSTPVSFLNIEQTYSFTEEEYVD